MNEITETAKTKSWLASKLRQQVEVALLLDISSSMGEVIGADRVRKIDNLRLVAEKLTYRKIIFSTIARESWNIPEPDGSTAMDRAFEYVKSNGVKKVVLITDGEPDNAELALAAAEGLEIDIVYIGDGEPPEFLSLLANRTGGKFQKTELITDNISLIESSVIGLIEGRANVING